MTNNKNLNQTAIATATAIATTNAPQAVAERLAKTRFFVNKKTLILGKAGKYLRHLQNGSQDANKVKNEFYSATGVRSAFTGRWLDKNNRFPMTRENVEIFCAEFNRLTSAK
jgi:hypothetical protein